MKKIEDVIPVRRGAKILLTMRFLALFLLYGYAFICISTFAKCRV